MRVWKPKSTFALHNKTTQLQNREISVSSSFDKISHKKSTQIIGSTPLNKNKELTNKYFSSKDGIQLIKDQIHKLRTQLPQFSELSLIQSKRKQQGLVQSPRIVKKQNKRSITYFTNRSRHRSNQYYLPELNIGQVKKKSPIEQRGVEHQLNINVILLKRDMRYRMQKLPSFPPKPVIPPNDQFFNVSVTAWSKNPQQFDFFAQRNMS